MNFGAHFVSGEQAGTFGRMLSPPQVPTPHPCGIGYFVNTETGDQSFLTAEAKSYLVHRPRLSVVAALQELAHGLGDPFKPFGQLLTIFTRLAERAQFDEVLITEYHLGAMLLVLARRPDPQGVPEGAPSRQRFCELAGSLLGPGGKPTAAALLRAGHVWLRLMDEARAELAEIPRLEQNPKGQVFVKTPGGLSQIVSQAEVNQYIAQHQELVAVSASLLADLGALLGDINLIGEAL